MARWLAAAGLAGTIAGAGCVPARDATTVVEVQRDAIEALAARSVHDSAALAGATEALVAVRRAALVARLESAALEASFAEATIAIDGWDANAAASWLGRFEHVLDDGAARRALVEELPEVRALDEGAAALLSALAARRAETAALYADALASAAVIEAVLGGEVDGPTPAELLREVYAQALRGWIDESEKREAADRMVERLLGAGHDGSER